jgi:hypothetical protein
LFRREESLVYVGTTVDAGAERARRSFPGYEDCITRGAQGDETAVSAGRAAAKLHGLVPGRDSDMHGYVWICCCISPGAKAKAEAYYFLKNAIGAATTLPASAAASVRVPTYTCSDTCIV